MTSNESKARTGTGGGQWQTAIQIPVVERSSGEITNSSSKLAQKEWVGFLICPRCAATLTHEQNKLLCQGCSKEWPISDGIPAFVEGFPYWGEFPLDQMLELTSLIQKEYWKRVLLDSQAPSVLKASGMILNLERANWHRMADLSPHSRVLDLGAGMGTISHALAHRFREVIALEPVLERVEFMRRRFAQEGLANVKILRASVWSIPFPPESFDLVVLNSVLEWLPTGTDGDPELLQQEALNKAFQLLRPGGYLYLGTDNRLSWDNFTGVTDARSGLPYVTILPRPLAHWYAKRKGRTQGYRNYVYSFRGYRKLLKRAGFTRIEFYLAIPSQELPRFYLPLENNVFSYYSANFDPVRSGRLAKAAHWLLNRLGLLKYLQKSFAIFARKEL
jgi:SAM-dependent methyltransferase